VKSRSKINLIFSRSLRACWSCSAVCLATCSAALSLDVKLVYSLTDNVTLLVLWLSASPAASQLPLSAVSSESNESLISSTSALANDNNSHCQCHVHTTHQKISSHNIKYATPAWKWKDKTGSYFPTHFTSKRAVLVVIYAAKAAKLLDKKKKTERCTSHD